MAVTDFGTRRFADSAPRQARDYPYQHHAQDDYDDEDYGWHEDDRVYVEADPESLGARLGRLTHYLGAVVSVVLLIGLVVWGYKLVARDVSGVPVIRAVQGEARTAPDDPGGELARNGGLSVNEVAAGVALPPSAEIAIAPAPTGLEEDDIAMGELADTAALGDVAPTLPPVSPANPVVAISDADAASGLAASVATDLGRLDIVPAEEAGALSAELTEEPLPPEVAPVVAAPRPARRPASITARAQAAPAAAPQQVERPAENPAIEQAVAEAVAQEPAPVSVPSGAPLVQIGAFDSNAIANGEWGRLSGRFSSLFSGKSPVVQTTTRNGRTFYRLRVAGFASRDDARRFCAALIAEGTDCYPAAAQ